MTTIMTVLIRTMGVTRRVIYMAKILKSCAGVTQVTFHLGLAYCRTVPIGRGQPVTGTGGIVPELCGPENIQRTDRHSQPPAPGRKHRMLRLVGGSTHTTAKPSLLVFGSINAKLGTSCHLPSVNR